MAPRFPVKEEIDFKHFKKYLKIQMRYISLFSGIGGFELGIQRAMGEDAECIGFSEIEPYALKVYQKHFPNHSNLGCVKSITREMIERLGPCDMVVGGFPCSNLSSIARISGNSSGLDGPLSGLFWDMVKIIQWVRELNGGKVDFIIENNASMKIEHRQQISKELKRMFGSGVVCSKINSAGFGVQSRRRLFWTTFPLNENGIVCEQSWDDVLEPYELICDNRLSVEYMNRFLKRPSKNPIKAVYDEDFDCFRFHPCEGRFMTRWGLMEWSNTTRTEKDCPFKYPIGNGKTIRCGTNYLVDTRGFDDGGFILRGYRPVELARLFFFPDDWCEGFSKTRQEKLYGKTVVVRVIQYIVEQFMNKNY